MTQPNPDGEALLLLREIDESEDVDLAGDELDFVADLIDKQVYSFTLAQRVRIKDIHRRRIMGEDDDL